MQVLCSTDNLDIIAVTETWLNDTISDGELLDPSFQIIRRDRNRNGGGVLLACKSVLQPVRRADFEPADFRKDFKQCELRTLGTAFTA